METLHQRYRVSTLQICVVLLITFMMNFVWKCECEKRVCSHYTERPPDVSQHLIEGWSNSLKLDSSFPLSTNSLVSRDHHVRAGKYNCMFVLVISAISSVVLMKVPRDNASNSISPSPSTPTDNAGDFKSNPILQRLTKQATISCLKSQQIDQPITMPGADKGKQNENGRKAQGQSERTGSTRQKAHSQTGTYSRTAFTSNTNSVSSSGTGGDRDDDDDDEGHSRRNNLASIDYATGNRRVKKKKHDVNNMHEDEEDKKQTANDDQQAMEIFSTKLTDDDEALPAKTPLNANANSFAPHRGLATIEEEKQELPSKIYQTVYVSRELTTNIIPSMVANRPSNVYRFMDKSMSIEGNKVCTDNGYVIVDFNFLSKLNAERLYCTITKVKSPKKLRWTMHDQLYTKQQLISQHSVQESALRQIQDPRLIAVQQWQDEQKRVRKLLMAKVSRQRFLKQTNWSNVSVEKSKKNNKRRFVLHMINEEFIKALQHHLERCGDDMRAIPVMSVEKKGRYRMQHVFVCEISENICIGIAVQLRYDQQRGEHLEATHIMLHQQQIREAHELATAMDAQRYDPHCLDGFVSTIDELCIGNPDEMQNKLKAKERQIESLQKRLSSLSRQTSNSSSATSSLLPMPQLPLSDTSALHLEPQDSITAAAPVAPSNAVGPTPYTPAFAIGYPFHPLVPISMSGHVPSVLHNNYALNWYAVLNALNALNPSGTQNAIGYPDQTGMFQASLSNNTPNTLSMSESQQSNQSDDAD